MEDSNTKVVDARTSEEAEMVMMKGSSCMYTATSSTETEDGIPKGKEVERDSSEMKERQTERVELASKIVMLQGSVKSPLFVK